jgi:predicted TPR repeat methyltransferase
LRPGGRFVFTVEELVGDEGHGLSASGRYQHAREYVEDVLTDVGFRSEIVPAELRLEGGEPVAGLAVYGRKS